MPQQNYSILTENSAKEIVISFLEAINDENFKAARMYVSDNMKFIGVLGSRDGADAYFTDMERMRFKYEIKKIFVERDDVCILYDINMSGLTIFTCGWYHVEDGKINSLKVVFDPRPVLESAPKK